MITSLTPTDDLSQAANLIYITAPDLFNMIFQKEKARMALARLIDRRENMFGAEFIRVFKQNGNIAGLIAGHSGNEQKQIRRTEHRAFRDAIGRFWTLHYFTLMVPVIRQLTRYTINEDEYYISNVGVDQAHRGKGIATRLIHAVADEQKAKGIRKILLDVDGNNHTARTLYEHLGFTVVRQNGIFFLKEKLYTMLLQL